jgi:hypothetical protein
MGVSIPAQKRIKNQEKLTLPAGCAVISDGYVKSPAAALRFILRHCGVRHSTPHKGTDFKSVPARALPADFLRSRPQFKALETFYESVISASLVKKSVKPSSFYCATGRMVLIVSVTYMGT